MIALDGNNAVVYPFAIIAAELGQAIHAEPQQSLIGIFKAVHALEFSKQAVAARQLLKGFQLTDGNKAHIRAASQALPIQIACAKARFQFTQVYAGVVASA